MSLIEKLININYSIATGGFTKKVILTPVWGILFLVISALFVLIPVIIEKKYGFPELWIYPLNYILSVPLCFTGIILILWTNIIFFKIKGTPVPVNPPTKLIKTGLFAKSRNPMTLGIYFLMFGSGFYLGSILSIIFFIPLYIYLHTLEFKFLEEPELEKRFGKEYIQYKSQVPRYFSFKTRLK
jgi:protein-S-isoprenylcysteine O-methyltransferase Ste14